MHLGESSQTSPDIYSVTFREMLLCRTQKDVIQYTKQSMKITIKGSALHLADRTFVQDGLCVHVIYLSAGPLFRPAQEKIAS